jgi:hypothetical protein
MTEEQLNSSLDILEASTGVRRGVTFEGFVDHTLLKEARLQQEKIAAKDVLAAGNQSLGRVFYGYGQGSGRSSEGRVP